MAMPRASTPSAAICVKRPSSVQLDSSVRERNVSVSGLIRSLVFVHITVLDQERISREISTHLVLLLVIVGATAFNNSLKLPRFISDWDEIWPWFFK